jgi:ankyrin repeat protein
MMSRELPEKPNLEHLKKQAKELLRDFQQGDSVATERFRAHVPAVAAGTGKLADALHVIAREYGFKSWPKLKEHVESISRALEPAEMLSVAVCASDAGKTARVLDSYPELKARLNEPMVNYGGMQALLAAVQRTDRKTIDVLLAGGADINARSVHWAGGMGVLDECHADLADFLIERGAVMDVHAAARLGLLEKLRELVSADPDAARARGAYGQTPLHFASTIEIAEYLLDQGAEIDDRDLRHESTAAQHMLRVVQARHYRRDRQDIARHLIARGCQTDILMAAALGDLQVVRRELEADPRCIRMRVTEEWFPKQDQQSEGTIYTYTFGPGRTPHLIARDFGHEEVFEFLMDSSPEDVKLAQALDLGDEGAFRQLLAIRPNLIETLSEADQRRLPDAAQNNNTTAVRLLLEAGWPVDARGEYRMTALQWASWHGNAEMVREILGHHPQIELKDCDHDITALGSALHGSENSWHRDTGDYVATVTALLDAGAKAPRVTQDLEASEAVRALLSLYEERSAG